MAAATFLRQKNAPLREYLTESEVEQQMAGGAQTRALGKLSPWEYRALRSKLVAQHQCSCRFRMTKRLSPRAAFWCYGIYRRLAELR